MDTIWNGLTRLARSAVLAGCALLLVAAFIVTAEVLVRKAIPDFTDLVTWIIPPLAASGETFKVWVRDHLTFSGSDEISSYLFAVGTSWSMAYVLVTRGHVRIDIVYGGLGPRTRAILDIIALTLLAIFIGALVERAYNVTSTNLIEYNRSNTNLRIPFAWAQIPWFAGILLFFVTAVTAILRSIGALFRGDYATVNATAGVSSQDEEIESELKGFGLDRRHVEKV